MIYRCIYHLMKNNKNVWRIVGLFLFVSLAGCKSTEPEILGLQNGKLAQCPDKPNCVSSAATDDKHYTEPLGFAGSPSEAWECLQRVVKSMKRSKVVTLTDSHLHVEFRSALFRFVDDVEFQLDASNGYIHVRSASRKGHSDMGVNRRRVETIRKAFRMDLSQRDKLKKK